MQDPSDSSGIFPAAQRVLTDAIRDHAFPGAACGVLHSNKAVEIAAGQFTYSPESPLVRPHTIFDLASVSKVIATTSMAMLLWEWGKLDLDRPVADWMAQFVADEPAESRKRNVTPRMLLAHSSGLPAYERLFERCSTSHDLLHACLTMPLQAAPDAIAVYSDIGFIILGHLLEFIAGERMDAFCQREIFGPLRMISTGYCPSPSIRNTIPPTSRMNTLRKRPLQGEVHDDNCWILGGVSGHAGLFSNVADLLQFARCILTGTPAIFSTQAVTLFTARQPCPAGTSRALGWDTPSASSSSGHLLSRRSIGHLGYTGTSLWIDPDRELAIVLLTNRTFPGDGQAGISQKIQQVRPLFHDALMQDLGLASTYK